MKITSYISFISILLALYLIYAKIEYDYIMYEAMKEVMVDGYQLPSNWFLEIENLNNLSGIILLVSITLSIIGFIKHSKFREWALFLNLFTILYLVTPTGTLIANLLN